jgi:hypothetical protein
MGMFKQLRALRDVVEAAPDMVRQAQQLGTQSQQMVAAQQAAMAAQAGGYSGAAPSGPDFEPVAGVSLDQFAAVSKGVAAFGYDQSKLVEVAASKGITAFAWDTAYRGWNERLQRNPTVAQRFNQLYREA